MLGIALNWKMRKNDPIDDRHLRAEKNERRSAFGNIYPVAFGLT
jgi:hypothetical protein